MLKINILDQEIIKNSNRIKILNLLYKEKELTKLDIAKATGISIPTVTNNINELIQEGIVAEARIGDSSGGRKPLVLRFLPDSRYSFGVNISTDYARIILTNLNSEIKYDISFDIESFTNFELIMNHIDAKIQEIIIDLGISIHQVLGIGFALPGTVNEELMVLENAPNLNVMNVDFHQFSDKFKLPLYIENEANAAAYAELVLGMAKELKNLVYISVTQGIGAGIVIQDHLYKGKNKRAGEFGHITIVPGGKRCKCGRRGCWEAYASIRSLLEYYNELSENKTKLLNDFISKLDENDVNAIKALDAYLDYLAIGIQNIILMIDPHYVVIGGELSQCEDRLINSLKEKVFTSNSFFNRDDIKILTSRLSDNSSILGASLLPLQKVFHLNQKII